MSLKINCSIRLRLPMTKSQTFFFCCLSTVLGVGVVSFEIIPTIFVGIIFVIGISLMAVWWRHEWKLVIIGVCVVCAGLGMYRYEKVLNNTLRQNTLRFYNDDATPLLVQGVIIEEPDERSDKTYYTVSGQHIAMNNIEKEIRGEFLVILSKYPIYHYGDLIAVEGILQTPENFSSFDYKKYLERKGIYSVMYYPNSSFLGHGNIGLIYSKILSLRKSFQARIDTILAEPYSSFLSALLLGTKKQIPDDLVDAFNKTGTTHIVAVSGYNIAIVAVFLSGILLAVGIHRYWTFWISVLGILFFTILTGAGASIVRASFMGILVLIANRMGRLNRALNALVFSGTCMVLVDPQLLRFDIGFQLSFMATLSLILWVPFLEKKLKLSNTHRSTMSVNFITHYIIPTFAAQILVLPILAYNFGRISLISVIANMLILPIIPLSMFLGFISGATSFVFLSLAKGMGYVVWVLLYYETQIVRFLADIPYSSIEVNEFNEAWVMGYYALIGGIYFLFSSKYLLGRRKIEDPS